MQGKQNKALVQGARYQEEWSLYKENRRQHITCKQLTTNNRVLYNYVWLFGGMGGGCWFSVDWIFSHTNFGCDGLMSRQFKVQNQDEFSLIPRLFRNTNMYRRESPVSFLRKHDVIKIHCRIKTERWHFACCSTNYASTLGVYDIRCPVAIYV